MQSLMSCIDVIKTRIQTQSEAHIIPNILPSDIAPKPASSLAHSPGKTDSMKFSATHSKSLHTSANSQIAGASPASSSQNVVRIGSESTLQALRVIFKAEGIRGLFAGVGPRFVWTSVQSSIMLFAYQKILQTLTGIEDEFSF